MIWLVLIQIAYAFWIDALVDDPPGGDSNTAVFRMLAISIRNLRRALGSMHRFLGSTWRYQDGAATGTRNYSRRRDRREQDHEPLKEFLVVKAPSKPTINVMAEALVSMDLKRGRRIIDLELFGMDFVAPGSFIDSGARNLMVDWTDNAFKVM